MNRLLLASLLLLVPGCSDSTPTDSDHPLANGVLATFSVEGETFRVWTDNILAIADLRALELGIGTKTIPNGALNRGPGLGDHNAPYSWHVDPTIFEMAEATIEVCSGLPSFVEADVDEWVDVVGQYCPWSAILVTLEDFR